MKGRMDLDNAVVIVHAQRLFRWHDLLRIMAADSWRWSFTGPSKYNADGTEIVYTIAENAISDYTAAYNGYNVTNSYTPGRTQA